MKKVSNIVLMTLMVTLIVATPACRSRRDPVKPNTGAGAVTNTGTIPDVPTTVTTTPTNTGETVPTDTDFVREDTPDDNVFPSDIEELNRYVQNRGFIRDAFYNYDEATLDDSAQAALTSSANWLKSREGSNYHLLVEGHCDERGTEQYNLALGDRRANSARDFLVALGVDGTRIRTVSYGEERPFEEGHDDSAWAQNRRSHLVLVRPSR
ncbi:MAG TPA: OmpA family protein [Thermoanaerobaculia bacterium]|nr:OmpA family protein [Thermoanaerobaculia bacterium]